MALESRFYERNKYDEKFIALLMGLTLVFSFTACGNTSPSNSSQNETSVDEQETSQSEASAEETFATENTESDASESELPSDLKQNRKMEKHWLSIIRQLEIQRRLQIT